MRQYDVYHDESKEAGFWHGILFVPRDQRALLLHRLKLFRERTSHGDPLGLKGLNSDGRRYRCIRAWIQFGVGALIQRHKGTPFQVYNCLDGRHKGYDILTDVIGARFVLFRVHDLRATAALLRDTTHAVETTFRFALKGGLHLFAQPGDEMCVASVHFDNYLHHGREIDIDQILPKGLKPEALIGPSCRIDTRSGNHAKPDAQEYDDCQFLQLTDLLVSGFRTVLGEAKNHHQRAVANPLLSLATRWNEGPARMRNSRWHRGISIGECRLSPSGWEFASVERIVIPTQPTLFDMTDASQGEESS